MVRFLIITVLLTFIAVQSNCERRFFVDYENNQFVKDGKPFRYVSGDLHYFRVPSVLWRDRMLKYKAAGLNAIQTYIEWSSHEPEKGKYEFSGENDIVKFLKTAQEVGLVVIIRAGPYIDSERDMGGFPYWLLTVNPNMKIRSFEYSYIKEITEWYSVLLPKLEPMLYNNGGPVITVHMENEYAFSGICDYKYMTYLRDLFFQHLGKNTTLCTTGGRNDNDLRCDKIPEVFATVDFGPGVDISTAFTALHRHQNGGPNVNSEYYASHHSQWEEFTTIPSTDAICNTLDQLLANNASVNVYMFHGGTSFGFGSGAYYYSNYTPITTSYDCGAPITEAGDPTPKYDGMRAVIGKYMPVPKIAIVAAPKMQLPPIQLTPISSIFDEQYLKDPIHSVYPQSFEQLKHRNGFLLYSTNITVHPTDPAVLSITGLGDRAQVFVDKVYKGTLSLTRKIFTLAIQDLKLGSRLDIFVENQGRVNFLGHMTDQKGITSNVTLDRIVLTHWNHYKFFSNWDTVVKDVENKSNISSENSKPIDGRPAFFSGHFTLPQTQSHYPLDTFLRVDGWSKGVAFINGFNLGRYWPIAGPQVTLYAPAHLFKPYPEKNNLVLFELEKSPCSQPNQCTAQFVDTPVLNGTTPDYVRS